MIRDLVDEFLENRHKLKKNKKESQLNIKNDWKVPRVKIGTYFNMENKFEKTITILILFKKWKLLWKI